MDEFAARSTSLVGRREELRVLDEAIATAAAGDFRFLALTGEPGVGKTRLLNELAARAAPAGFLVLAGRASEYEREVPFGVLVDALGDHVPDVLPKLPPRVGPAAVARLSGIFPTVADRCEPDPATAEPGAELNPVAARHRLHGTLRLVVQTFAKSRPLALLLDGLHWGDSASLGFLDYLVRNPPRAGVLVATAFHYRPDVPSLARLIQADDGRHLDVKCFDLDETAEYLGPGFSRARQRELHRVSGGNPFYLDALSRMDGVASRDPQAEVPLSVQAAIQLELGGLSESALLVARAAAVAADAFEPGLIAVAAGVPEADVVAALDELVVSGVVQPSGTGRFRFRHPLVRNTVYSTAAAGWRHAVHARIARHLEQAGAPATLLAHHVENSARYGDAAAIDILLRAARAVESHAPSAAAFWFSGALRRMPEDHPERVAVMLKVSRLHVVAGELEQGERAADEVMRLLPRGEGSDRARAARFSAMTRRLLGRVEESRAVIMDELRGMPDRESPAAVHLRLRLVAENLLRMDQDAARALLDDIPEHSPAWDAACTMAVAALRPMCSYADGQIDRALGELDAAGHLLAITPDAQLAESVDSLTWLCWSELLMGRPADALRHFERVLAVTRATGQHFIVSVAMCGLARAETALGRLAQAAVTADEAVELAEMLNARQQIVFGLAQRSVVEYWRGNAADAVDFGQRAVEAAGDQGEWWSKQAELALGLALVETGQAEAGGRRLLEAANGFARPGSDIVTLVQVSERLAELEAAQNRHGPATEWAAEADRHAHPSLPVSTGLAALARAHSLLGTDPGAAADHARGAADVLASNEFPLDAGRALLTAATGAARASHRDTAKADLQRAAEVFGACGAASFLRRVVREQRRLGIYVPVRGRSSGPHDLSRRELEVAELVSAGRTNQQIAEALFISARTVESHLAHIFAKLGVSSRAGVVSALKTPSS
ncbi:helix-turn-helix transcriptional regulator [Actinomadura terrae]|uniref:helix-turn-helix transcriptional regulator n=1 Tax=Actinomadura terrae TaxID=604353 RepID=UPI002342D6CF|nr:LuxR family transcriptional regulator [Actinomadura terrae]